MESLFARIDRSPFWSQSIPLAATLLVLGSLVALLHASIATLNLFPFQQPVLLQIHWVDVAIGMTVYLKTSIDFAILMGRLMSTYPGWRGRVAIEVGTALGNALGTILIIIIWIVFKDIHLLLALMILLAALVLFELAGGSMDQITNWEGAGGVKRWLFFITHRFLDAVTRVTRPLVSRVMPDLGENLRGKEGLSWRGLLLFSMSVPFILGLDDFAGYVPLFSIVNVYGFAIGVLSAHTLLNIALFLSPQKTIAAVRNEFVAFAGAIAFIGLGIYGLFEVGKILVAVF